MGFGLPVHALVDGRVAGDGLWCRLGGAGLGWDRRRRARGRSVGRRAHVRLADRGRGRIHQRGSARRPTQATPHAGTRIVLVVAWLVVGARSPERRSSLCRSGRRPQLRPQQCRVVVFGDPSLGLVVVVLERRQLSILGRIGQRVVVGLELHLATLRKRQCRRALTYLEPWPRLIAPLYHVTTLRSASPRFSDTFIRATIGAPLYIPLASPSVSRLSAQASGSTPPPRVVPGAGLRRFLSCSLSRVDRRWTR